MATEKRQTGRPWKQHERDGLLKMHKEGKSTKTMSDELERTESAIKQKLRLLLIEALKCSACCTQFESEKALKLHQSGKQDAAHKKLREQNNKKKYKKRRRSNITNVNVTIQQTPYIATNYKAKKKEEKKEEKKSKSRSWKQHEQDGLLKMHKKGKSVKAMSNELGRTENAIRQKLRLLVIEEDKKKQELFTCFVCLATFKSEKALKLHQLKKQDAAHKKLRDQNNKKNDGNIDKKKKDKMKWNSTECADWIYSLGDDYKKYAGKWKSSNITGELLNELDIDDLAEIVQNRIHRKGILNAWKKL